MDTEHGMIEGNIALTSELTLHGMISGGVTVKKGGILHLHGMVTKNVIVEPGGIVNVQGMVLGNAINQGGELHISGTIDGQLIKKSGITKVDSNAVISNNIYA